MEASKQQRRKRTTRRKRRRLLVSFASSERSAMATVGFPSPPVRIFNSHRPGSCNLRAKSPTFRVRCSAEAAQDTATAVEEETVVGTSKRSSSSLISADNVQKALRSIAITDADHYGRLGLARGCFYDQVTTAYEQKCEELRKQELDDKSANSSHFSWFMA